MLRSLTVFVLLWAIKQLSRMFYRHDFQFVGENIPKDAWANLRVVAFLNHTSLFEPVFLGAVPTRFLWRLAAHGVVPAADKTTDRASVDNVMNEMDEYGVEEALRIKEAHGGEVTALAASK